MKICILKKYLVQFILIFCFVDNYAQQSIVTVNYDFNKPTGITIDPKSFGVNVFQGFNPDIAGNPGNSLYKTGINELNPGIIRYHSWEMMGNSSKVSGWLTDNEEWDAVKINKAMSNSYPSNPEKMMNIPRWPEKMMQPGSELLRIDSYDSFAAWCASLVKIINIDQKRNIKYWEVLNERDDLYGGTPSRHDELAKIYNIAAKAMKLVDPTIKIGGPAFAQPSRTANVDAFCSVAHQNLDFISYHTYAVGTTCGENADDKSVLDKSYVGWATTSIRNIFKKYSNRNIDYFHDEFNISYCPPDQRQNNGTGMIFDALSMKDIINAGGLPMAWNECDGWYGKMSNSYEYRPSLYLFKNWNKYLILGDIYESNSSNVNKIDSWCVKKGDKFYMIVINRALTDVNVQFSFSGLPASVNNATYIINHESKFSGGVEDKKFTMGELKSEGGIIIPNGSVALFEIDMATLSGTGDTQAPTMPENAMACAESDKIYLSWEASQDNVGVKGYEIFLNNVRINSNLVKNASHTISGLSPNTLYSIKIISKDSTGNQSTFSTPISIKTLPYKPKSIPSILTNSSFVNYFLGNSINDDNQISSHSGKASISQDDELRISVKDLNQYENLYGSSFIQNTIDLSSNSNFTINIKSTTNIDLRVKLVDNTGNQLDKWQNDFYIIGDNQYRTYSINFATHGFANLDASKIKEIKFMYTNSSLISGDIHIKNLKIGMQLNDDISPSVPTNVNHSNINGSAVITWNGSTDNIKVIAYKIYKDGQLLKIVNSLSDTLLCLKDGVNVFEISAIDQNLNESGKVPVSIITGLDTYGTLKTTLIYPNPSKGKLNIEYYSEGNEEVNLKLKNSLSEEIAVESYTVAEGKNLIPFNLYNISSGTYYLQILGIKRTDVFKIIIEK